MSPVISKYLEISVADVAKSDLAQPPTPCQKNRESVLDNSTWKGKAEQLSNLKQGRGPTPLTFTSSDHLKVKPADELKVKDAPWRNGPQPITPKSKSGTLP